MTRWRPHLPRLTVPDATGRRPCLPRWRPRLTRWRPHLPRLMVPDATRRRPHLTDRLPHLPRLTVPDATGRRPRLTRLTVPDTTRWRPHLPRLTVPGATHRRPHAARATAPDTHRHPTRVRRLLGDESGQILPFTVILVLLVSVLVFGFMGAAVAEGVHIELQSAADAAALAAAGQAVLWEEITVRRHLFDCVATKKGWDCHDAADAPATVRAPAAHLFPNGWIADARCQYPSDARASVPPWPDPATVCDTWRLRAAGFEYPSGSDPQGAAAWYFARNVARLRTYGVPADLTTVRVNGQTAAVEIVAQAVEPGNPLGVLLHGPVRVEVRSDARPHLTARLAVSGP